MFRPASIADIEALKKNDGLLQTDGDAQTKRGKK